MRHVLLNVPIEAKSRIKLKALFLGLFIFFYSFQASAQTPPHELEQNLLVDSSIAGGGLVFMLLAETLLKEPLAHEECLWCEPPGFDESARNGLKWNEVDTPLLISDTLAISEFLSVYSMLAFAGSQSGNSDFIVEDMVLLTEAVATTMVLTNVVKWIVGRQRPFAHFDSNGLSERESNLSFFSGHSSLTASMAAAGTTLAFLRGYDEAPIIMTVGSTLALATAYFRVAGDAHYLSDVLTGLLVGGSMGVAIPLLFHGRKASTEAQNQRGQSISIGPSSVNFSLSF